MIDLKEEQRNALFVELRETRSMRVRNELVESYVPLAEFFANRYRNRGAEDEDLRQVAKLALVKAVDRFDLGFGVQFSTFAGRTIDGELKRYFRDKTWAVKVPRGLQELSLEVRSVADRLSNELGRAPTVRQLADATGFETDDIIAALDVQTAYRARSLDRPVGSEDEEGTSLGASLGSADPNFERTEVAIAMRALLETLPPRERQILELRFFDQMTQSEIADSVGISQMHVSRLIRRSLEQLKAYLR